MMWKVEGLLIVVFLSLLSVVISKNYQFEVTYECERNEFLEYKQKLLDKPVFGCKNWVQKILIIEPKMKYVRFESAEKEKQEQAQEDQQKEFEQQQQMDQKRQELEKQIQEDEILEQIEEIEKQKEKQQSNQEKTQPSTKTSTQLQQEKIKSQKKSTNIQSTSQKQTHKHQTQNQHLTHKLANIFHKIMPLHNRHNLTSNYHTIHSQNATKHYFELRHFQQEEGEQQKHKPLKSHRSHPVEDVMFLLELIQMNSIILERTYSLRDQDIASLQELKKKHPIPTKKPSQQGGSKKEEHYISNRNKYNHLRNNL